jgi:uncharacterized membrane protein YccC
VIKWNENTADALRNTAVVLTPLLLLYSSAQQLAVGVTVGALLISLTDLPGNRRSKSRSALQSIALFFLVSMVFSASLFSPLLTGIVLVVATFLLAMLPALGVRSGAAGAMATALMVFLLGLRPHDPWLTSFYILIGCCWFYLVTLIQVYLAPFRSLRQALQEALEATGDLLETKAACYDPKVPLEDGYRRIIKLHIRVSEKQELVRQLLLSDRAAMRKQDVRVEKLVQSAIRVISLYEQVIAMHYDYAVVRERLAPSGALALSQELGSLLAAQAKGGEFDQQQFENLLSQLAACGLQVPKAEASVIQGIITNVRAIRDTLYMIGHDTPGQLAVPIDTMAFLPDKGDYQKKLKAQLHFYSPVLRFALRLAILMGVGYTATRFFSTDPYSYWMLLTIIIVARPRLSVTWQRNWERLAGTGAGVLVAALLLWGIQPVMLLLLIAALGLFGFFVWNRPKYGWSVACITVCVLVSLSVYRGEPQLLLTARVGYSLAGCVLAIAGIFLFPVWSHAELEELVKLAVTGNREFLAAVGQGAKQEEIWLKRKTAHLRLARLSEGMTYARQEPGKHDLEDLEHIQVLNYRINAVIISLFLTGRQPNQDSIARSLNHLDDFLHNRRQLEQPVNEKLLKGTQLLEALSCELAYFVNT